MSLIWIRKFVKDKFNLNVIALIQELCGFMMEEYDISSFNGLSLGLNP